MLESRQCLKRKLIIHKKNKFFNNNLQIFFNPAFSLALKDYIDNENAFFTVNKYVSKHSSSFFLSANKKFKFPLKCASLKESRLSYTNIEFHKKVVSRVNSLFFYIHSINLFKTFSLFNIFNFLKRLIHFYVFNFFYIMPLFFN